MFFESELKVNRIRGLLLYATKPIQFNCWNLQHGAEQKMTYERRLFYKFIKNSMFKFNLKKMIFSSYISNNFQVSFVIKILAKMKRISEREIFWLDEANARKKITLNECELVSYAPNFGGVQLNKKTRSKISLYVLSDVVTQIHSSNFIFAKKNKIYIERVIGVDIGFCNYSTGNLIYHNSKKALTRFHHKKVRYKNILFMGGNGSFNYYHWLIEIIPKFLYINDEILSKNNIDCIIFSSDVRKNKSFGEILKAILIDINLNIKIDFIEPNYDIYAENLFYMSTFNNIVFNSKNKLSDVSYSYFCAKSLKNISEKLIGYYYSGVKEQTKRNKIFLARNAEQVRSYNQDEVLSFFQEQGFIPVLLNNMSMQEQINIFQNADFIVGPSGAAWSNIIFCRSGTKMISWLPKSLEQFSSFSSLAKIFECDLHFLISNAIDENLMHSDYVVDINSLNELYGKLNCTKTI